MAGQEEVMRLVAELQDKFSPQLKSMQRSLRSLAAETGDFHKKGVIASKSHTESLLQLRREVTNVGDRVRGVLSPSLATLGISGLSAAGAIAAVTASIKEFSTSARNLSFLSKETGLTINQLRTLEALAPRIGTSVEQMDSSLRSFGENMEKLRRSPLSVLRQSFEALNVRPDPAVISSWRNLIGSMEGLPRAEQLGKVVQYLDRIRDMGQKRVVLGAFGLPPELSRLSGRELQEAIDRIRKIQRDLSPEEVAGGKAAAESIEDISLALKNLRDRVGAGLAPDLAAIAKSLADFANLHSDEVVGALRDLATWVKSADWAAVGRDLRDFASGANNVAQALGGWKPVLEFLAAYKIAQLLGLTSAIGGLARALGTLGAVASPPAWLLALLGVAGAVAADRDRQRRGEKGPGGLYGTPLYGFGPMGEPDLIPQGPEDGFRGNQGDKGEAAPAGKPLWRRLFDNINQEGGLLHKSSFEVPEDWKGALKGGAGADSRGAEGVIERGVLQALRDFAAEQKPGDAGGGGGGGSGIGAIKAAYQPGGAGGFGGAGNAAGEPSAGGGAGVGGGPASEPMGTLGGKPVGVEQLGGGLNRDAFNKMFSGTPLAGHADDVIKAARENGVSPSLMAGIMAHETGRGTSAMLRQKNNPAGLMHGSTGMQFGSIGEGIAAAGRTIGKNFRAGGGTIEGMAKTYAPVGAANDPGGLNAGWPSGVRRFMSQLEGGSASPPRFNVGDVKTALAGSSGTAAIREGLARERGIYGSANLFSSGRAAAAGIPGGVGRNLTKITTAGGHTMTVNAEAAPHFKSFVEDLERRGYNIRDLGSLAIRGKRGGGGMSEHAFGNAIDINPAQNPFHSSRTDMPKGVEDIAAKYGLTWGGTWRPGSRDPMHFEWTGKPDVPDAMHGEALKRHFGVGQRSKPNPDLLGSARQSGLVGPPLKHEVTGSAHLKIDLGGFPKGTTTKMRNDGELFKTVALSRGRAMPPASQTG